METDLVSEEQFLSLSNPSRRKRAAKTAEVVELTKLKLADPEEGRRLNLTMREERGCVVIEELERGVRSLAC
jgi:hypothetical protein